MTSAEAATRAEDRARSLCRLEGWAGEVRINLIRLAALVFFYAHHLSSVYVFKDDPEMTSQRNAVVTAVVLLWSLAGVGLHLILSRRWLPPVLPYLSIVLDLVMIGLLVVGVGGPKSALILLLFLVVASTPPRMALGTVYLATLGGVADYLAVLSYYVFVQVGATQYYSNPEQRIPRSSQVIFVLALLAAGLLAGQAVRQTRRLVGFITSTPHPGS